MKTIPIFRIFDEAKAKEFYVDFLGFVIELEHRVDPDAPLFMQVRLDDCFLNLSEHFGDASPGSHVCIEITDVVDFCRILNEKQYRHARPGTNLMPWGTTEMCINDPFGNRLTFSSRYEAAS